MRTLVTGGSGYFGEVIVKRLLERGDRVSVLDLVDNEDRPRDVEFIRGDVRDPSVVKRAVAGVDIVHHDVAQVPLAKDHEQFWSVNVGGTEQVLEASLRASVRKVVLVSSSAVYGVPSHCPVTLRTLPLPREAYGRAKLAAERVAARFVERGLDVSIVRPRTVLGHGRLLARLWPKSLPVRTCRRSTHAAFRPCVAHQTLLGDYHTLMYGREMFFDITSTRDELGHAPRWSNAEMIAQSYDFYVSHREAVLSRRDASHHRSAVKLGVLKFLEYLP